MSLNTSIRGVVQVLFYTTRTVVHIIRISRKHLALLIFNLTGQVSMTNSYSLSSVFISRVVAQFMDDDAGRHGHVEAVQGGVRGEAGGHQHALGGAGEELGGDAGTLATQH